MINRKNVWKKYDYEAIREILDQQEQLTLFAECVYDVYLNKVGTKHTDQRKWSGLNILGQIYRKVISSIMPPR